MIYFISTQFFEAEPLIKLFQMKKDLINTNFQLFQTQDACLIITGTGNVTCAIATTYLLTLFPPKDNDLILHIGLCLTITQNTTSPIFLCNKITDAITGQDFYPDMIYRHPFSESAILSNVKTTETITGFSEHQLFDTESSGFCQACKSFVKCNQIMVIKIVTPDSNHNSPSSETFMGSTIFKIISWINELSENLLYTNTPFFSGPNPVFEKISEKLFLSVTMKQQFYLLLHYYELEHKDVTELIDKIQLETQQIKNKQEGKKYFEQLRQKYIF